MVGQIDGWSDRWLVQKLCVGKIGLGGIQKISTTWKKNLANPRLKQVPGIFKVFFSEKCAGHVSGQVSGHAFMQHWNFFGLRGDFPYCKRFVLAGTNREARKQSLLGKISTLDDPGGGAAPQEPLGRSRTLKRVVRTSDVQSRR